MAQITGGQYVSGYEGMAGFGQALRGLGAEFGDAITTAQRNTELANARAEKIKQWDEFQGWLNENKARPDLWPDELNNRLEGIKTNIMAHTHIPSSKTVMENELTGEFADWQARLNRLQDEQIDENANIAFKFNYQSLLEPPAFEWQQEDVQKRIIELESLIQNGQRDGLDDLRTPKQAEFYRQQAYKEVISHYLMQKAEKYSLEEGVKYIEDANEIATMFGIEDEFLFNLEEKDKMIEKLKVIKGQQKILKNATYEANLLKQSGEMLEAYSNGRAYMQEVLTELQPLQELFNNRIINNTMDSGDGITYPMLKDEIMSGYYIDDMDLFSAYASGLSTQEFRELSTLNAENKRLTPVQNEQMATYTKYIDAEYSAKRAFGGLADKIPFEAKGAYEAAIQSDTALIKNLVRQEILKDTPSEQIYKQIQAHFIADTDKYLRGWWGQLFSRRSQEVKDDIVALTEQNDRYEIIMDLMKSKEEEDKERLRGLLVKWYGK